MIGWTTTIFGDVTENHDSNRVPVKRADRKNGPYPYYGASGIVDYVEGYLFDGEYLLVSEDGANLLARSSPVAFMATGKFWVNNHAHIVNGTSRANTKFLCYVLSSKDISGFITGSAQPKLSQQNLNQIPLLLPPRKDQDRIVRVLGSLDQKLSISDRTVIILERMATAIFYSWFQQHGLTEDAAQTTQDWIDRGSLLIGDGHRAKRVELSDDGLPFIRAGNLQDHGVTFHNAEILGQAGVDAAGVKLSQPSDVTFTSKGTVGRITFVSKEMQQFVYSPQLCWWRVIDREAIDPHVLYRWMKSREFMGQVASVKGQTDMADYVSLRDQRRMRLTLPSIEKQDQQATRIHRRHDRSQSA